MTKEIERKWLPSCHFTTNSLDYHASKVEFIEQRYFHEYNEDGAIARVRQYSNIEQRPGCRHFHVTRSEITTKVGMGVERGEHNVPIDNDMASTIMRPNADELTIRKVRYTIPFEEQGVNIEVDVYEDENKGLIHIEVEFPTRKAADEFKPLHWFGKEVTDEKDHTNASLQLVPWRWRKNK